jgi:hypothetical protein
MPLYELGMTQDEIQEATRPAPEGDYLLTYEGLIMYKPLTEEEDVFHPTKAGGKMVKAKFVINSPDPKASGKRVIYTGVVGSFSFSYLCAAIPIMSGTGVDSEAGIGRQVKAHLTIRVYENPETGEVTESNEIKGKLTPA